MIVKTIEAKDLNHGDIIAWNSGYYDKVEAVSNDRKGDIVVLCNNYTATMIFEPNELLKVRITK